MEVSAIRSGHVSMSAKPTAQRSRRAARNTPRAASLLGVLSGATSATMELLMSRPECDAAGVHASGLAQRSSSEASAYFTAFGTTFGACRVVYQTGPHLDPIGQISLNPSGTRG